jgi:outer membrane protein
MTDMKNDKMKKTALFGISLLIGAHACAQQPQSMEQDFPDHIRGDLGVGVFKVPRNVLGKSDTVEALPYAYFDYGRLFARLDTFGIKTVRLGAGYLELAARINFDGMDAERGLNKRANSVPLGIGTLQETPFGAFFMNAFYDVNQSHGSLFEAIYAAEFQLGGAHIYPQLGIERRSAGYNNYFYGVTPSESAASGYRAYRAGASNNPILALSVELPLAANWAANLTWRRKWLSNAVADSPIVNRNVENTAWATVSYHFN